MEMSAAESRSRPRGCWPICGRCSQAAGSDLSKVVKTTVFLVDMADFTAMNEVYGQAFGDHKPARTTVAVAALPRGVRVEIDVVATV